MYSDINSIVPFKYPCVFYTIGVDESKPLDQQVEEKIVVLESMCDIQESAHMMGKFISSTYVAFVKNNENEENIIRNGLYFECNVDGLEVNGKVSGVFPSQLGGIKVYIQDLDV